MVLYVIVYNVWFAVRLKRILTLNIIIVSHRFSKHQFVPQFHIVPTLAENALLCNVAIFAMNFD